MKFDAVYAARSLAQLYCTYAEFVGCEYFPAEKRSTSYGDIVYVPLRRGPGAIMMRTDGFLATLHADAEFQRIVAETARPPVFRAAG